MNYSIVKKARKEQGVRQSKLAEMIGVSNKTISAYERGTRRPPFATMKQIADILHLDVALIMDEGDLKMTDRELFDFLKERLLANNEIINPAQQERINILFELIRKEFASLNHNK